MGFFDAEAWKWRQAHLAQNGYKKGFLTRAQFAMELDKLGYDGLTIVEILETDHIPYKHVVEWIPTDEATFKLEYEAQF